MKFPSLKTTVLAGALLATTNCDMENRDNTTFGSAEFDVGKYSPENFGDAEGGNGALNKGNKEITDALNAVIAGCKADSWVRVAICQETASACSEAGKPALDCDQAKAECDADSDKIMDECMKTAKEVAGCDFTDSKEVDSDRDGLSDAKELFETFTNPCDEFSCGPTPDGERDSDGDGILDADDMEPTCSPTDSYCGIPLRPGTEYGNSGAVVGSSCDLDSDYIE